MINIQILQSLNATEMEKMVKQLIFKNPKINQYICPQKPEGSYKCRACDDRYLFKSSYLFHINRSCFKVSYYCEYCDNCVFFTNRCQVILHLQKHNITQIYLSDFEIHLLTHEELVKEADEAAAVLDSKRLSQITRGCKTVEDVLKKYKLNKATKAGTDLNLKSQDCQITEDSSTIREVTKKCDGTDINLKSQDFQIAVGSSTKTNVIEIYDEAGKILKSQDFKITGDYSTITNVIEKCDRAGINLKSQDYQIIGDSSTIKDVTKKCDGTDINLKSHDIQIAVGSSTKINIIEICDGADINLKSQDFKITGDSSTITNIIEKCDGTDINLKSQDFKITGDSSTITNIIEKCDGIDINLKSQDFQITGDSSTITNVIEECDGGDINSKSQDFEIAVGSSTKKNIIGICDGANLNLKRQDFKVAVGPSTKTNVIEICETMKKSNKSSRSDDYSIYCMICYRYINTSMFDHFQRLDKSTFLNSCQLCSRILPNGCVTRAHHLIHMREKPFVCPECGLVFITYNELCMHINSICYHDNRIMQMHCPVKSCQDTVFETNMYEHFNNHVIFTQYECSDCSLFFNKKLDIITHKGRTHGENLTRFNNMYMCAACNTSFYGKDFEKHVFGHFVEAKKIKNIYRCFGCGCNFFSLLSFKFHILKCNLFAISNRKYDKSLNKTFVTGIDVVGNKIENMEIKENIISITCCLNTDKESDLHEPMEISIDENMTIDPVAYGEF